MSVSPWSIYWRAEGGVDYIGGTLDYLRISNVVIQEGENATGTMSFDIQTPNAELYPFFAARSRIQLLYNGARFWEGTLTDPVTDISPGEEVFHMVARDPSHWFEDRMAYQTWKLYGGSDQPFNRLILFAHWDVGGGILTLQDAGTEIGNLLTAVIADGAPILAGTIDAGATPTPEVIANVSFAQAIMTCGQLDQRINYFKYESVGDPAFYSTTPDNLTPVTVTVGTAPGMAKIMVRPTRFGVTNFATVRLLFADDSSGLPAPVTAYEKTIPVGYSGTLFGGVEYSADASPEFTTDDADRLAQAIYDYGQRNGYAGTIEYQEVECTRTLRLGQALNLYTPSGKWSAMNAPIRQVTRYIDTGKTVVEFGPSEALGPADLFSLVRSLAGKLRVAIEAIKGKATGEQTQFSTSGDNDRGARHGTVFPPLGWEAHSEPVCTGGVTVTRTYLVKKPVA